MAEWLIEDGIGETRAALVDGGSIVEAAIELPGGLRAGTVAAARLAKIIAPGRVGLALLQSGEEVLIQPLPKGVSEGGGLVVEVTREAIDQKRPQCRAAPVGNALCDGPDLATRIAASGASFRRLGAHEPDALEAAGWSELIDAATSGAIAFPGGGLLMSLTPAMTLLDVDGSLAPPELAVAGAAAAGCAIRALGVTGSIGIDLPTLGARSARQLAAAALDAALPPPFERTAVNGFGFLQVVRPQRRASLPQLIAQDPLGAYARALLRRAERIAGRGRRTLTGHPQLIARLHANPDWLAELERRTGTAIALRSDPTLAISGGHGDADHP